MSISESQARLFTEELSILASFTWGFFEANLSHVLLHSGGIGNWRAPFRRSRSDHVQRLSDSYSVNAALVLRVNTGDDRFRLSHAVRATQKGST